MELEFRLLKEILEEQKRTNELLKKLVEPRREPVQTESKQRGGQNGRS